MHNAVMQYNVAPYQAEKSVYSALVLPKPHNTKQKKLRKHQMYST